ncbi:MAG: magnesium transporter [Thermotogota bacterium]
MKIDMKIDVKKLIDNNQLKILKDILKDQEPAYIVEMIEEIEAEDKVIIFRLLQKDTAALVFSELEKDDQKILLSLFKEEKIKEIVTNLDPDDRTDLFEELPANVVKKLLAYLSPEERRQAQILLNYPEDSAGRIMTPDLFDLREKSTSGAALKKIKEKGKRAETIYTLFVIDENRKLTGVVELDEIIFSEESKLIQEIMNDDPLYVSVYDTGEEAAMIMRDYDLLALPVVDSEKRLVGIITVDDIIDIIEESATEDIQKMAAVNATDTSYLHTSIWKLVKSRVVWLIMLLLLESMAVFIIDSFSAVLQKITILAAFIPTINAMGGNTGSQMSAVIIRSMALGELDKDDIKKVLKKEIFVGTIIALILSVVMGLRAFVNTQNTSIILALSSSLIVVVLVSNFLGSVLPFFAKKFKVDPALISGPLISTIMDVISMAVYFSVSMYFLKDML